MKWRWRWAFAWALIGGGNECCAGAGVYGVTLCLSVVVSSPISPKQSSLFSGIEDLLDDLGGLSFATYRCFVLWSLRAAPFLV